MNALAHAEGPADNDLAKAGKEIYDELRLYHGTSRDGAARIRENGFDTQRKTAATLFNNIAAGTITSWSGAPITRASTKSMKQDAGEHNFFTKHKTGDENCKTGAEQYASYASTKENPPHLVRLIIPENQFNLELDPKTRPFNPDFPNPARRTKISIPPGFVLGSKKDGPKRTEASEVFRLKLEERIGDQVTPAQAESLLNEVQTPSEKDFGGAGWSS